MNGGFKKMFVGFREIVGLVNKIWFISRERFQKMNMQEVSLSV